MAALVIHAPKEKNQTESKRSFDTTFKSGIGDGYAIWKSLASQITPNCKVIVLSKDERKRAEGVLVKLVPVEKTASGIQRYDVKMRDLKMVPFKDERLNRNGVAVL
jgi:hypothetical protein